LVLESVTGSFINHLFLDLFLENLATYHPSLERNKGG